MCACTSDASTSAGISRARQLATGARCARSETAHLARRLIIAALALAAAPLLRAESSLHDFELRRMDIAARESLSRYAGQPLLLMVFEPECGWCLRQSRAIDALIADCQELQAVIIGTNGSRRDLRETYRRYRSDSTAYQASSTLVSALGGVTATPFTVIGDAEGRPLGWLQGYVPEDGLRAAVDTLTGGVCAGDAGPG